MSGVPTPNLSAWPLQTRAASFGHKLSIKGYSKNDDKGGVLCSFSCVRNSLDDRCKQLVAVCMLCVGCGHFIVNRIDVW